MNDLYFREEQGKLNDILKGTIEILKHPLVSVSRVNPLRYKVASQNGCFVVFVDGLDFGKSSCADLLEFGNTKVRTVHADTNLMKELSGMVLKKYLECTEKAVKEEAQKVKTRFLAAFDNVNYFKR